MKTYDVNWSIDIDASSPREAAERALEIMQDPDSSALFFEIEDIKTKNITAIDFMED